MVENVPAEEAAQIKNIVELTLQQLRNRYDTAPPVLRGVHAKAHGCVTATFEVLGTISEHLQHGVFAEPGKRFDAQVRFSNAATLVRPDSKPGTDGNPPVHGSRGIAIKLHCVSGERLEDDGLDEQDFLLVNQPVFAFANVEDYEVLSRVLVDHNDDPRPFFAERLPPPGTTEPTDSQQRAMRTAGIVSRIQSASLTADVPAFQPPPASPVDNDYFGASPFLLGDNDVMRFRLRPVSRSTAEPDVADPDYLRTALVERLKDDEAGDVVFHFEVQSRSIDDIEPETDIENASADWPETYPFEHVATLTIPLQEFDTPELNAACEALVFTPWTGLKAHRPLGGINRLRQAVYAASAAARLQKANGCEAEGKDQERTG